MKWAHVAWIPLGTLMVAGGVVIFNSISEKVAARSWARSFGVK